MLEIEDCDEQKPKYEPFECMAEFLNAYRGVQVSRLNYNDFYLSMRGIWLTDKHDVAKWMVTAIWEGGVDLDNSEITWKELLEFWLFLDGSPCGKEKKNA